MSGAGIAALAALATMAVGVVWGALGDMAREEARTRLSRVPFVLIRMAVARLPRDLRDDLAAEWDAELEFVVSETDGMPLTRLARGIRYSGGLLFSAGAITAGITDGSNSVVRRPGRALRTAAGVIVASIGTAGSGAGASSTTHTGELAAFACLGLAAVIMGLGIAVGSYLAFSPGALLAGGMILATSRNHTSTASLLWSAFYMLFFLLLPALELKNRHQSRQQRSLRDQPNSPRLRQSMSDFPRTDQPRVP